MFFRGTKRWLLPVESSVAVIVKILIASYESTSQVDGAHPSWAMEELFFRILTSGYRGGNEWRTMSYPRIPIRGRVAPRQMSKIEQPWNSASRFRHVICQIANFQNLHWQEALHQLGLHFLYNRLLCVYCLWWVLFQLQRRFQFLGLMLQAATRHPHSSWNFFDPSSRNILEIPLLAFFLQPRLHGLQLSMD